MKKETQAIVEAIGTDTSSGATDILTRAADALLADGGGRDELIAIARACARGQPSMAGLLTLEALVIEAAEPAMAVRAFLEKVRRAPYAIARHAASVVLLAPEPRPAGRRALRVVTCSSGRVVEETLRALARQSDLTVCCAESRPKREGLALARRLATQGFGVELFTDAGISSAVQGSDAVLVGADAIGPEFFVNKVGTAALCALGSALGVPVYALAGREKLLRRSDLPRVVLVEGAADQVFDEPTAGVRLRNPYFERVPLALLSLLVTDAGLHHPLDVAEM